MRTAKCKSATRHQKGLRLTRSGHECSSVDCLFKSPTVLETEALFFTTASFSVLRQTQFDAVKINLVVY